MVCHPLVPVSTCLVVALRILKVTLRTNSHHFQLYRQDRLLRSKRIFYILIKYKLVKINISVGYGVNHVQGNAFPN